MSNMAGCYVWVLNATLIDAMMNAHAASRHTLGLPAAQQLSSGRPHASVAQLLLAERHNQQPRPTWHVHAAAVQQASKQAETPGPFKQGVSPGMWPPSASVCSGEGNSSSTCFTACNSV
jgi:hypothetical protein